MLARLWRNRTLIAGENTQWFSLENSLAIPYLKKLNILIVVPWMNWTPAFAHFMPLCHILLILEIRQTIYQEKDDESLKTQMMVNILSNKAFFNWASLLAQW